jgi:hypothetical protein
MYIGIPDNGYIYPLSAYRDRYDGFMVPVVRSASVCVVHGFLCPMHAVECDAVYAVLTAIKEPPSMYIGIPDNGYIYPLSAYRDRYDGYIDPLARSASV